MNSYSVHFKFSQHFDFPAEEAFRWCTDYSPGDIELMGDVGRRKVRRINEDTFILTDENRTKDGKVVKRKLVRVYPERLSWTNTRISQAGKHSQFLYQVVPEEGGSRLEFTGSQIYPGRKPGLAKLATIERDIVAEDTASWRNLAKAMAKDLSPDQD
jgi:hypothetical protein